MEEEEKKKSEKNSPACRHQGHFSPIAIAPGLSVGEFPVTPSPQASSEIYHADHKCPLSLNPLYWGACRAEDPAQKHEHSVI